MVFCLKFAPLLTLAVFVGSVQSARAQGAPVTGPEGVDTAATVVRPPNAGKVAVKLVADVPNATFLVDGNELPSIDTVGLEPDPYLPLCEGPCDVRLVPRDYHMALGIGKHKPIAAHDLVAIRGPSTVRAHFTARRGIRALGIVLVSALTPIGLLTASVGALHTKDPCATGPGPGQADVACTPQRDPDNGVIAAGLVLAGVGLAVGIPLIVFSKDSLEIDVLPLAASLGAWRPESRGRSSGVPGTAPQGLVLRATF